MMEANSSSSFSTGVPVKAQERLLRNPFSASLVLLRFLNALGLVCDNHVPGFQTHRSFVAARESDRRVS